MLETSPPPIEESATIAMGDRARQLQEAGTDVINLGSGTPDFVTPDHIIEAGKSAMDEGHTQMETTAGLLELRRAIANKLSVENGLDVTPDRVGVTPGSKYALFAAINSIVREGDEVALLDPSWVSYKAMVRMAGGTLNEIRLNPETNFTIEGVDLSGKIDDGTRALVINNPSNPTGTVYSRSELETIRDLAVEHDVWVIVDEIYEKMTYGTEHVSIGSLDGMADRTVTTNGFSKAYAMSGWRLGYFTGPQEVVDSMRTIQSQTVSSATSFVQHAAVTALEGPQTPVEEMRQTYESRIGSVLDIIADAGVDVPHPAGSFYLFVPVGRENDVALAETILESEHVTVTPGSAFGVNGYIRIACTVPEDRLVTGVRRITKYLGQ